MKLPQFRFSLRVMLAATFVVALGLYWLMLPTLRARQFVEAVQTEDFATAQAMLRPAYNPREFHSQMLEMTKSAEIEPLTLSQLWDGRRKVNLWLAWGGGAGYVVTRDGVSPKEVYW